MSESYDVFLSHSSEDKSVVHSVAERLKSDGLRVWLDDWELPAGRQHSGEDRGGAGASSRVLVFCMSANEFGSDWAQGGPAIDDVLASGRTIRQADRPAEDPGHEI